MPQTLRKKKRPLFVQAEIMSNDLSLLPGQRPSYFDESSLEGVISLAEIDENIQRLKNLDVDSYIQQTVMPSDNPKRKSAPEVIKNLGGNVIQEESDGPLFMAEIEFVTQGRVRRFGFIAQNRKSSSGVWSPRHHLRAAEKVRFFASHGMPLITFMDTPGAAADSESNLGNQSHSISFLIAEMANLQLPTVGIVFGQGYSGGAIPLATTNILLSLRDGVFNTIHPKGLSNIARKYNLSWEECAKYVGTSAYELCQMGYFDGIVDYTPEQAHLLPNLRKAILSSVDCIEANAKALLRNHDFFYDHYRQSIQHYLNPSEMWIEDNRITDKTPTGILNIFGDAYRFLRYLKLRYKLQRGAISSYSRLSALTVPTGQLQERLAKARQENFQKWLKLPMELRYQEELYRKFKRYVEAAQNKDSEPGKIVVFFMGDPKEKFETAVKELTSDISLYLYNYWKENARESLTQLYEYLGQTNSIDVVPIKNPTLLDVLRDHTISLSFRKNFQNIILFDLLFNSIMESLAMIAGELNGTNQIKKESVEKLFESAFDLALKEFEKSSIQVEATDTRDRFFKWLRIFVSQKNCDQIMQTISDWKQRAFPRLSPPLFGLVRYYFSNLLPSLQTAHQGGKFDGKITPRNIGIKDFWNRLDRAYKDLLIQNLIREYKKKHITASEIIDQFFQDFEELFRDHMTGDPVKFPGFRQSIEKALDNNIPPCGVITGVANYVDDKRKRKVGLVISNTLFQAGAFDMASCDKVCQLLVECTVRKLPVIMFISSGGMQTKEGAGALFSMAVVNDRITRFIKGNDLPIICFGYRDCTGGAQASFVTHRLVKTYYLSGTMMSFAGQLVVESHLPMNAILANYLSAKVGSMDGLVHNPFDEAIDGRLQQIDSQIPMAQLTIRGVISRILAGEYGPPQTPASEHTDSFNQALHFKPIHRMLVHARGCTAARLIQGAHDAGKNVVLVQSDADMDSYPTTLLNENDRLVCIGGNTPQESYLNAMSVIKVAEQEEADALHPGIGFLSESPKFAEICREHDLNFIGPTAWSMNLMGNKTNAIATAKRLQVPVVPGSDGVLTDPNQAQEVAKEIGFPVLIKSAHGGGGKGIRVVEKPEEFVQIFGQMSQEALNAFGNGELYLEKYITSMRHVEIQVLRDSYGNSQILGARDCSVQRNYQKLIEESSGDHLPQSIVEQLFDYARTIIDEINYIGAGTVEFIFDRQSESVYFMEMNTRLQVEHPVSEMVTDVDLVQKQLEIAEGQSIADMRFDLKGHAMELRITAEKIELQADGTGVFLPDPGEVSEVAFPTAEHIRVLPAIGSKTSIPPYYDSLIVQLIAWGETRSEVIERLQNYLQRVRVHGVCTNIALMEAFLADPVFQSGDYDTGYVRHFMSRTDFQQLSEKTKNYAGSSMAAIDVETIAIPDSTELKVLSPQTGAFYRASSPSEPSYVEENQVVSTNHTMCLLESMKVFNDVSLEKFKAGDTALYSSDFQYRVKRIIPEDGQTVSRGDLLFVVEPVKQAGA